MKAREHCFHDTGKSAGSGSEEICCRCGAARKRLVRHLREPDKHGPWIAEPITSRVIYEGGAEACVAAK